MIRNSIAKTAFVAAAVVASSAFVMQPSTADAKVSIHLHFVAPTPVNPVPGPGTAPPPQRNVAPKCGQSVSEHESFCSGCGARFDDS